MITNKIIEKIELAIFISGIIIASLTVVFRDLTFFPNILFLFCLFYLFGGWYFLKGANQNENTIVRFIVGYFFASAFLCIIFACKNFPLSEYLSIITIVFLLLIFLFLFIRSRKIKNTGYTKLLIQIIIMAIFAGMPFYL